MMDFVSGKDYWAHVDLFQVPSVKTRPPGRKPQAMHARCTKYFKGLSGQMKLFPAVFDHGKESFESTSASSSYRSKPMACAAALMSIEVIEVENLLERSLDIGELALQRMAKIKQEHPVVGDVRAKGCLMGIELVKGKATMEPFDKVGDLVYQKAFRKGLAWMPARHILRMIPPIAMEGEVLLKGLDMIDEALGETEKELL